MNPFTAWAISRHHQRHKCRRYAVLKRFPKHLLLHPPLVRFILLLAYACLLLLRLLFLRLPPFFLHLCQQPRSHSLIGTGEWMWQRPQTLAGGLGRRRQSHGCRRRQASMWGGHEDRIYDSKAVGDLILLRRPAAKWNEVDR
jgi:hypothetical protein